MNDANQNLGLGLYFDTIKLYLSLTQHEPFELLKCKSVEIPYIFRKFQQSFISPDFTIWLQQVIAEEQYPTNRVHFVLPAELLYTQVIEVPNLSTEEINELLHNKLIEDTVFGNDDNVELSFTRLSEVSSDLFVKTPLLYTASEKGLISGLRKNMASINLEVISIDPYKQALKRGALWNNPLNNEESLLLLDIGPKLTELSVYQNHNFVTVFQLPYIHSALADSEDEQDELIQRLNNIFLSLQLKFPGGIKLETMLILSQNLALENFRNKLLSSLHIQQISFYTLRDNFQINIDLLQSPELLQEALPAIGATLYSNKLKSPLPEIDLLASIRQKTDFFNLPYLLFCGLALISLVVIVIIFELYVLVNLNPLHKKLEQTQTKLTALNSVKDIDQKVYDTYVILEPNKPALYETLAYIQECIPEDCWLTKLNYKYPTGLTLEGEVILESSLGMFVQKLGVLLPDVKVESVKTVNRDKAYYTKFIISCRSFHEKLLK